MPSLSIRRTLLSLVKRPKSGTSSLSPRDTAHTIKQILDKFAEVITAEPDAKLRSMFSDSIDEFRLRLDVELNRIALLNRPDGKGTKKDKASLKISEDIQKALEMLELDIERDEVVYQRESAKSRNLPGNDSTTQQWLAIKELANTLELRPPEHVMQNPMFYMQPSESANNLDHEPTPPSEEEKEVDAKMLQVAYQARWMSILRWASAPRQEWRSEAEAPFDPTRARWKLGRFLSEGSTGRVFAVAVLEDKCDDRASRVLALKKINTEKYSHDQRTLHLDHCRGLHKAAQHPHVIGIVAYDGIEKENRLFMQYISGGTLKTMMKHLDRITQKEAIPIIRQIARGLQHIHSLGYVHRDLKGENVLISLAGCAKICDLDTAKDTSRPEHIEGLLSFGSANWMSPEAASGRYSARSDVWSLGCMVTELLTGKRPWGDTDATVIIAKLRDMDETGCVRGPPLPAAHRLGPIGRAALAKVFVPFESRIGASTLLEDPWLACGIEEASTPVTPPAELDMNEAVGDLTDKPLMS